MKKLTFFAAMLIAGLAVFSQAPQSIKYQAVARTVDGDPVINQDISVKISILAGTLAGEVVYSEQHHVETNSMGLFIIEIGNPDLVLSGSFENITWGISDYFLKLEMDQNGGTNYQYVGTSQLLSVPFALNSSSLTLTNENGKRYSISVDTLGNLISTLIEDELLCGDPFTDSRDNHVYNTVQIGDQCWMQENLAWLPGVSPSTTGSQTVPFYYVYDYEGTVVAEAKVTDNYQTYAALYNWPASLIACPTTGGWHLPDDDEWTVLTDFLGGGDVAGGKMKEAGTEHWFDPNVGATNSSGFTALPGGYRSWYGYFYTIGEYAYWWSSTEHTAVNNAWIRRIYNQQAASYRAGNEVDHGVSVRCVRDNR